MGVPELRAKVLVSIAGVGNAYDRNYYVEKVTHKLNQSGYTTKFEAETPPEKNTFATENLNGYETVMNKW